MEPETEKALKGPSRGAASLAQEELRVFRVTVFRLHLAGWAAHLPHVTPGRTRWPWVGLEPDSREGLHAQSSPV